MTEMAKQKCDPWALEVADAILELINSRPQTPRRDELAALIIGKMPYMANISEPVFFANYTFVDSNGNLNWRQA